MVHPVVRPSVDIVRKWSRPTTISWVPMTGAWSKQNLFQTIRSFAQDGMMLLKRSFLTHRPAES
jgi:hypothetical protein